MEYSARHRSQGLPYLSHSSGSSTLGRFVLFFVVLKRLLTSIITNGTIGIEEERHLLAIDDALGEDAVLVANAVAVCGQSEGRHRVEEACGETTQTSVAQTGILLHLLELFNVEAHLVHGLIARVLDAQVDGRVGQGAAHVELERQVVDALHFKNENEPMR